MDAFAGLDDLIGGRPANTHAPPASRQPVQKPRDPLDDLDDLLEPVQVKTFSSASSLPKPKAVDPLDELLDVL